MIEEGRITSPQDGLEDRLREICGEGSAAELLGRWYWRAAGPGWAAALQPYLAGLDQSACLRFAELHKLPPLRGISLMLAFLAGSRQRTEWVHYALVTYLMALHRSGVREAALPLALHAFMALDGFGADEPAAGSPQEALAASLAEVSPMDAIRHGLQALKAGNINGLRDCGSLLHRRGLVPPSGVFDLASAVALNRAIGSPVSFDDQVVVSADSPAVRRVPRALPDEVIHAAPAFDDSHYIFAAAGKPMRLHPVDIQIVSGAIFSGNLSKMGRPEFYTIAGNACVSDLSLGTRPFVAERVIELDGPLLVTADAFSGKPNICHFLLDQIPRLLAYRRLLLAGAKLLLLDDAPYFHDALRAVGVEDLVVPSERWFSYCTPQLFLHSNMFRNWDHPANLGNPETLRLLREAFGVPTEGPADRRLMISRNDADGRRILNWEEVQPVLTRHGYETVVLSAMSFDEQRRLFSGASHVVGVHGAGLTNILFAPAHAKVLEILPPMVATSAYWMLARGIGQSYGALIGDDPELPRPDYATWVHDATYNSRDLLVDVSRLEDCLRAMG